MLSDRPRSCAAPRCRRRDPAPRAAPGGRVDPGGRRWPSTRRSTTLDSPDRRRRVAPRPRQRLRARRRDLPHGPAGRSGGRRRPRRRRARLRGLAGVRRVGDARPARRPTPTSRPWRSPSGWPSGVVDRLVGGDGQPGQQGREAGQLLEVGGGEAIAARRGLAAVSRRRTTRRSSRIVASRRTRPARSARSTSSTALSGDGGGGARPRHRSSGPRAVVTPDGQEELVLLTGQAGRRGLLLAPAQEPPQAGAEGEQLAVLIVVEAATRVRCTMPVPAAPPHR